jgi:hypothetical protein
LNTKAIPREEFPARLFLDTAVHEYLSCADQVLGLSTGIGQASRLEGLRQGNMITAKGERGHETMKAVPIP